jgi:ParB family chromosome partitioning protein
MSKGKRKGLGRGLSALFGDQSPKEKTVQTVVQNKVSISDLSRNPYQPRQSFNEKKLDELSNSIKKNSTYCCKAKSA